MNDESETIGDHCFSLDYYKEQYFDYALTIGMSVEEYWFGDPHLIYRFEQAYSNKRKIEQQNMWLLGTYIQSAISSVPLNVAGFIEKQSQLSKYPECPYQDLFSEKVKEPISEEQKQLYEYARHKLLSLDLLRDD